MPEIAVKRKHYHDGGDIEFGAHNLAAADQTVSVCSCGRFVRFDFRGEYPMCGWYWVPLNPWLRWRWRHALRAYRAAERAS